MVLSEAIQSCSVEWQNRMNISLHEPQKYEFKVKRRLVAIYVSGCASCVQMLGVICEPDLAANYIRSLLDPLMLKLSCAVWD